MTTERNKHGIQRLRDLSEKAGPEPTGMMAVGEYETGGRWFINLILLAMVACIVVILFCTGCKRQELVPCRPAIRAWNKHGPSQYHVAECSHPQHQMNVQVKDDGYTLVTCTCN